MYFSDNKVTVFKAKFEEQQFIALFCGWSSASAVDETFLDPANASAQGSKNDSFRLTHLAADVPAGALVGHNLQTL